VVFNAVGVAVFVANHFMLFCRPVLAQNKIWIRPKIVSVHPTDSDVGNCQISTIFKLELRHTPHHIYCLVMRTPRVLVVEHNSCSLNMFLFSRCEHTLQVHWRCSTMCFTYLHPVSVLWIHNFQASSDSTDSDYSEFMGITLNCSWYNKEAHDVSFADQQNRFFITIHFANIC